jgi:hypothetical protein
MFYFIRELKFNMNKKTIASLFFIIICLSAHAQVSNSSNSISLSLGPSFPVGSYGNKEINGSSNGFAKPGPALNISFSHLINKNWGLSLTAFGQRNNYDTKAMEDAFAKQAFYGPLVFSSYFPLPNPTPTYTTYPNWKFEKNEWWIGGLMAGAYMQFPSKFSQDFLFTIKAQAGAVYVESPETKGVSTTDTVIAGFSQSGSHGIGFSYSIGAGAQYKLSKKLYWITNLDFLGTNKILFKDITNTLTVVKYPNNPGMTSVSQSVMTGNGKQSIQSINFTVGLGFVF